VARDRPLDDRAVAAFRTRLGQQPQQQRLAGLQRPQRLEAHGVLRADAADEALEGPVEEHERGVAGADARRARDAHDARLDERGPGLGELPGAAAQLGADHCGGAARPCIASHTRLGVHGMSMWSIP